MQLENINVYWEQDWSAREREREREAGGEKLWKGLNLTEYGYRVRKL
jgi:hypothetical protein